MKELTATMINKAMPLNLSDVRNGIIDGYNGKKRGFISDQEIYDSAYSYARAIVYSVAGVDTRTGQIIDLLGGCLINEATKENLLMRLSAVVQAGGFVDELP